MYRLDDERLEGSPAERDLVVLVDLSNPLVRIVPKLHRVWILDDSVWNQELDSMIFVGSFQLWIFCDSNNLYLVCSNNDVIFYKDPSNFLFYN